MKLALHVLWSACWTGLPAKLGLALLMMAMGSMNLEHMMGVAFLFLLTTPVSLLSVPALQGLADLHLGEGAGLGILFLLCIPIDMWAVGLTARTVFIERLKVEPQGSFGVRLWGLLVLAGGFYVTILWLVEGLVTGIGKDLAHWFMELELIKGLPVAERIGVELMIWGSISTISLVILLSVGLKIAGAIIQREAAKALPLSESYQHLVTRWDLMRIPADQTLMLTSVTAAGVLLIFVFWGAMPVTTPHPHQDYKKPEVKVAPHVKPADRLAKGEKVLAQVESQVVALEARQAELEAEKQKGKPKPQAKDKASTKSDGAKGPAQPAAPQAAKP
ncbi:MAG TPA: hypothetical protein VLA99_06495 [Nitrospiraceae bacterium]|nr:hypothetical protein [Nitrospiraceae bacterium]